MLSTPATQRAARRACAFDVGDLVVHPYHGAGVVVSRRRRRQLGGTRAYLEIYLAHSSLKILVPCDAAARVGLRAVVGPRGLRRIIGVLEDEPTPGAMSWSARRKHYQAKLKGGDVLDLAAGNRDLAVRAAESKLSSSERELYERSRRVLISELRYALGVDAEQAAKYIDEHVESAFPSGR